MQERSLLLDREKTQEIRSDYGLQAKIARRLGVTPQRLSAWLRGINPISETYLKSLCAELEKQPTDLLTAESEKFLLNLMVF